MENRSYALITGIFALVMGAALVMAIWWFGEEREPTREYLLVSRGSIGNLNVQAGVRYRGIAAGKVTAIELDPEDERNILVTISIREELPVTMGTRATLDSQGVTGIAFVQLTDDGSDPRPLTAGEGLPRLRLEPSFIARITEVTLKAMQGLGAISQDLNALLSAENRERFADILVKLDSLTAGLDRAAGELPKTLADLRELVGEENQAGLRGMLRSVEQAGDKVGVAGEEFRGLITTLEKTGMEVQKVLSEAGDSLGRSGEHLAADTLPRVDSLLNDLSAGARRLDSLLEELEEDPRIILRGRVERELGPGER